jgi:hypothetical protein
MNAIARLDFTLPPMPSIARLQVVDHLIVRVEWSAGIRRGRTDMVDLSPMICTLKVYRPLRENEKLFRTVHLIEDGRVLAWGDDDEIDMAADSVEELAEETMTPDDLRNFLRDNNLTQSEAAALLDRSRRQILNYLSGDEPIPRGFVLSCFGLLARKQMLRGPITQAHAVTQVQVISSLSRGSTETQKPSFRTVKGVPDLNFGEATAIEPVV